MCLISHLSSRCYTHFFTILFIFFYSRLWHQQNAHHVCSRHMYVCVIEALSGRDMSYVRIRTWICVIQTDNESHNKLARINDPQLLQLLLQLYYCGKIGVWKVSYWKTALNHFASLEIILEWFWLLIFYAQNYILKIIHANRQRVRVREIL